MGNRAMAVFDATNSTDERRDSILKECARHEELGGKEIGVVFIESICNDKSILDENLLYKVQNSPDYIGVSVEEALKDIYERNRKYEERYETITNDSLSYIKIFDHSSKIHSNLIYGWFSKSIVPALSAWNVGQRPIFLCRAGLTGENENDDIRVKRCAGLNEGQGLQFRDALKSFMEEESFNFLSNTISFDKDASCRGSNQIRKSLFKGNLFRNLTNNQDMAAHAPTKVMCSSRVLETINFRNDFSMFETLFNLNPLDKGEFTGLDMRDIKLKDSQWYCSFVKNPYFTRFPGGESYYDFIQRLDPCVIEMEEQLIPVLVISHLTVIQVLLSYFRNQPVQDCLSIKVPFNTVFKLVPTGGGVWLEEQIPLLE